MARGHLRADMVGLGADRGLGFLPEVVPRPVPPYVLEQRLKKAAVSVRNVQMVGVGWGGGGGGAEFVDARARVCECV